MTIMSLAAAELMQHNQHHLPICRGILVYFGYSTPASCAHTRANGKKSCRRFYHGLQLCKAPARIAHRGGTAGEAQSFHLAKYRFIQLPKFGLNTVPFL